MAKLVDALCSGRSVRKDVLVRIQFWAQTLSTKWKGFFISERRKLACGSEQIKMTGHAEGVTKALPRPS